jgi:hypothetical protein
MPLEHTVAPLTLGHTVATVILNTTDAFVYSFSYRADVIDLDMA